jgi:polyferredoxin
MMSQPTLVQIEEPIPAPSPKAKKKLVRRVHPDDSQRLRRGVQLGFLGLNIWIGTQFYLFVRYYETGGASPQVARPAGIEGWLPIAALMNLKAWLLTGEMPRVHPAGMFLLIAFLLISFLLRKSFCSWLCPVGTISENLWLLGRKLFKRNFKLPRWADIPLRALKYVLLALFAYAVAAMPVMAIHAFLSGPYGIVADVKMLNFFRDLSTTAAEVLVILLVLSVLVQNFWCRYLCPYGALMGLASLLSPLRIKREPKLCIDCAKCAKACPSLLPVDELISVRSAECTGCLECVAACPAEGALQLCASKRRVPAWAMAAGIAVLFFGIVGYARLNGQWHSDLPQQLYFELVPRAAEFSHP